MRGLTNCRRVLNAVGFAAVLSVFPACGGGDENEPSAASQALARTESAFQGQPVLDRTEALQLVARGIIAPLNFSELAHVMLIRAFEQCAAPGDHPVRDGPTAIDIQAADNAEGLLLRGEPGHVRALLRFDHAALGRAAHIDGAITLEVSRTAAGAASARRSQADALSVSDGSRTLSWSYLYVEIGAQQVLQALNVVSDVPIGGSGRVALDATLSAPAAAASPGAMLSSGRYVATGVISSLNAGLTLQVAGDGAWAIDIDNGKDGRVDFAVQASAQETRALTADL